LLDAREIEAALGTELAKVFAALEQRDDDVGQRDAVLLCVGGACLDIETELFELRAAIENGRGVLNHDQKILVMKIGAPVPSFGAVGDSTIFGIDCFGF
jgi:hypothetical protein